MTARFSAQVILNGHVYATCLAAAAGTDLAKEGDCFTRKADPDQLGSSQTLCRVPGLRGGWAS